MINGQGFFYNPSVVPMLENPLHRPEGVGKEVINAYSLFVS